MGCGNSKNQIGVVAVGDKPTDAPVKTTRPNSKTIRVQSAGQEVKSAPATPNGKRKRLLVKRDTWTGSQDSLGGQSLRGDGDGRGGSATSKNSHHSTDSGFDDTDKENKFISEDSDLGLVKEVEDQFQTPRDLSGMYSTHIIMMTQFE